MSNKVSAKIDNAVIKIKSIPGFENVKFIILHGSASRGEMKEDSDIDLCIYYKGDQEEASDFRYKVLSELFEDYYDIQLFENRPLYVKKEVLKGEPVYLPDKKFLYDIAYDTIKEYDLFKKYLYDYIGKEAIV